MTSLQRVFWSLALGAAPLLAGCGDGHLDVLEPDASGGASGASGSSGTTSGGSAGNASRGGASGEAGHAGRPDGPGRDKLPSPFVLDDFEDNDTRSPNIPDGYWYFESDRDCKNGFLAIEVTDGPFGETHAIRARGEGCRDRDALLGLDLGYEDERFDASSFDALRLWARAAPGSATELGVTLLDPDNFRTVIELDTEWREFVLRLDDFEFDDREPEEPFDPDRLTHLQFFALGSDGFDYWLDDLAFVRLQ